MKNLNNLLQLLLENNIDFVLIGGFAAAFYGATQVTQDVDICALLTPDNIEKLRQALKDQNPKHRMNPKTQPSLFEFPGPGKSLDNMYLATDIGVLDILGSVKPIGDFKKIKERSIEVQLFGSKCRIVSLEDLIEIKKTMSRDKDKSVLKELELILKSRKV